MKDKILSKLLSTLSWQKYVEQKIRNSFKIFSLFSTLADNNLYDFFIELLCIYYDFVMELESTKYAK